MALSGSVTSDSSEGRRVTLNWTATQNRTNNTSTISWELVGSGSFDGYVVVSELRVTIDGTQRYYRDASNHTNCYIDTILASDSLTLTHNDSGDRSFTVEIEAGIYQWAINCSGEKTFTLDTIPRAASISTASNTELGNGCTITWTAKAAAYYYRVRLEIGNWVWVSRVGAITNTGGTSYSYTTPILSVDIADELPNATSGTMTVYLYTYSDSGCTKQVGSRTSKTITVTIPSSMIPTLDSLAMDLINTNQQLATWGIGVIGKTAVRLTATATGVHSSTISKFVISNGYSATINGSSLNKTIYANEITTRGNKVFTVKAVDSRNRNSATSSTTQIYFYEYSDPIIDVLEIARDSSDNTQINIKAMWSYSSLGNRNSATARLRYKSNDSSVCTEYSGSIIHGNTFAISGFDEDKSYNFQLIVEDAIDSSVMQEVFIPTIAVTFDLRAGGKGIAFGKICESDNFEVGMDTIFMGDVYIETDPVNKTKITLEAYVQQVVAAMNNS